MAKYRWQIPFLLTALGLVGFLPLPCPAQTPADRAVEEELRGRERQRSLRQQQESRPDVRLPRPAEVAPTKPPGDESPCFPIERIVLEGEDAEHFRFALDAVAAAAGRCLGAGGIDAVLVDAQNALIAAGYVTTRVLAAPQDLTAGRLALTVVPGRVRDIRFAPGSETRVSLAAALPLRRGDRLNLRDIEQGLENLKRLPGADAEIRIEPAQGEGARAGESDLVVTYRQGSPLRLTLSADDSGVRATGRHQGTVTLSASNPLGLSDLLYFSTSRHLGSGNSPPRGSRAQTLHYSLPYGNWTFGLTANRHRYDMTIAGIHQTYRYSGLNRQAEIRITRLIQRDATRKTHLSLRADLRSSRNFIDDTEIAVQRRRMAGWEAALMHREFIGPAVLDASLAWRQGIGAWGARHAPEEAAGEGTARARIALAHAALDLPFAIGDQRLRYGAVWRAQWPRTPLVPQDRFPIGGRYTVRGFDGENVLAGDRGWLLRNDLGGQLGASGQELYLGLDHGRVGGPSARHLVGRRLTGAVLGLRGGYANLQWDVFIGRPLSRPAGFTTAHRTAGFNLTASFP